MRERTNKGNTDQGDTDNRGYTEKGWGDVSNRGEGAGEGCNVKGCKVVGHVHKCVAN